MTVRNLFIVNAIVSIIFGVVLVVIPAQALQQYGVELPAAGVYVAQLVGSSLIGYAIITWLLRNEGDGLVRQTVLLALFVGYVIAFVASLISQLNGLANGLGWTTVVIDLLFALASAYFRFIKTGTA